jgi:Domain of unknown function (DUF6431)
MGGGVRVILYGDEQDLGRVLDEQSLSCPHPGCAGTLYRDGHTRSRTIRGRDGQARTLRPRRARCRGCDRVQVLLPAWACPRRADDAQTIAAALGAAAGGAGHRPIASALGRPASTVRGWLRAARAAAPLLRQLAVSVQHLLHGPSGPEQIPLIPPAAGEPLAEAVAELITAAQGCQQTLAAITGRAPGIAECLNLAAAGCLAGPGGS